MSSESASSLSFEEALGRLEEIAQQLERGAPSLEHALQLVEEGLALQRRCRCLLEEAEGRFRRLVEGAGGEMEALAEAWPDGEGDGD